MMPGLPAASSERWATATYQAKDVYPAPILDMSAASVENLIQNYNQAISAAKTAALAVQ